jgi:hypothetical protein
MNLLMRGRLERSDTVIHMILQDFTNGTGTFLIRSRDFHTNFIERQYRISCLFIPQIHPDFNNSDFSKCKYSRPDELIPIRRLWYDRNHSVHEHLPESYKNYRTRSKR